MFCLQLPSRARHSLISVREICENNLRISKNLAKWLPHRFCKESVAITLSTTCDLAIECLDVRAIGSLDVRVATIVVRMIKTKKVATSRFSNFDSATPSLLAMLHRMVFALLSHSSE